MKASCAIILWCTCLLASCGHHAPAAKRQRIGGAAVSPLLHRLHGSWISHDYMLSLAKTRSPIHSSLFIDGIFSFIIDTGRISQDTLYFTAMVRGHEENAMWIVLDQPDAAGHYPVGYNSFSAGDGNLSEDAVSIRIDSPYITLYTATHDSLRYILYDGVAAARKSDYMLRQYTTKELFHGDYSTTDSTSIFGSSHIAFDQAHMGRITGSPLYDSFDINIDILEQKDSLDYMEVYDTRGVSESHSYTYRIRDNNIKIYPLHEGEPCRLVRAQVDTASD